ncbi:MAG: NADH-quinone oxidoreductase subunit NuoG [Anaerolineales bacterium]|nr:NADH-quinone oxidoreductase subunit NuoG [Anaerolineales bacterium]
MTKTVTLTIDNHPVTVPAGTLIVDAAKKIGVDIPIFCYHPKMAPVGMCRMCLVEVGRPVRDRATGQFVLEADGSPKIGYGPKLETGCTVPVEEGMVVRGYTEKVTEARDEIVEFILTSHPLDCPVCDKGGECPLQNLTMAHGPGSSRFEFDNKMHFAKHVPLGDLIYLDRERCIQCARCIRFQDEIADDSVLSFFNRGRRTDIVTYSEPGFDSYWSGNTSDICPVGALTTSDFRFGARPWELNSSASICNQCPVGCNLTFNTRREAKTGGAYAIKRVMPRQNEQVNEIWVCDKGRFSAYHFSESADRLSQPLIRKNGELTPATWGEALDLIGEKMKQAGEGTLVLASGRLSNEDLYTLRKLVDHQGGKALLDTHVGGGDFVAQVGLSKGSNLSDLGPGDTILVIASDLEEEAPVWWLRVKQAASRGANLIVVNPRETKLDRAAKKRVRYVYGEELKALAELKGTLGAEGNCVLFYGSEGLGLEGTTVLAQACANILIETGHFGKPNNGLVAVHRRANDQGAWDLGFRPSAEMKADLSGAKLAYVVAANPYGDYPDLLQMSHPQFLVVQDLFLTETAKLADVVLPAQAYVERDGSYTSGERRVQRFYTTVPARSETRADYTITAQIALRVGLELEGRFAPRVFAKIGEVAPEYAGMTFSDLAQVEEQWPIVGRGDMYYGGTTYENSQGLGVQLAAREGATVAEVSGAPVRVGTGLVAVPVTRLYDRGTIISRSKTLTARLSAPAVVFHPNDAQKLMLVQGMGVKISWNGSRAEATVDCDGTMPEGFVLVPRSLGMTVNHPVVVEVEKA